MQDVNKSITLRAPSSSQNLAHSIGRGTLFGIAANFVQVGTRIVTVPIVIGHLGLDGYGIWSIIMTAAAYMRFGSVGIKCAFQKYVAEATGNGDYERANKLLSTGCAAMLVLSVIGLIPIAIFSRSLARVAGVPGDFVDSTAGAISLLALIMVLSNVGAPYEAIVMGAQRIDLTRKFGTVLIILEAVFTIVFLHLGYGLFGMSAVMAASEICYLTCCYFVSRHVLPEIQIDTMHLSPGVLRELCTYAGSYQLVNILEVLYGAILPVAVLKFFGANFAGVYAIAGRLVAAALLIQDAMLLPILSGGSMVYATRSAKKIRLLLTKSYKTTLVFALIPLAFISGFGRTIILVWTGEAAPAFRIALWLMSLAGLFKCLSLLELVLYRSSGKALMDNLRQVLRIAILLVISLLGRHLGFYGILAGLAAAEFAGMVFMYFAIADRFSGFNARMLLPDTLKLIAATVAILAVGIIVGYIPPPLTFSERLLATIRLGVISVVTLVSAWPALVLTRSVSRAEIQTILGVFKKKATATA